MHVGGGDGERGAVGGEGEGGDGGGVLVELAEALLVGAVPDVDEAVGAARGEGVVVAVEADGVHRVDQLDACVSLIKRDVKAIFLKSGA